MHVYGVYVVCALLRLRQLYFLGFCITHVKKLTVLYILIHFPSYAFEIWHLLMLDLLLQCRQLVLALSIKTLLNCKHTHCTAYNLDYLINFLAVWLGCELSIGRPKLPMKSSSYCTALCCALAVTFVAVVVVVFN